MDATGLFVTPALVESHVHLDTAMTAGQLQWNESGTLFEGIQRWSEHKALLTEQDVLERATAAVTREVVHGVLRESKK
jgi:cytosine deaminase